LSRGRKRRWHPPLEECAKADMRAVDKHPSRLVNELGPAINFRIGAHDIAQNLCSNRACCSRRSLADDNLCMDNIVVQN
jgi:hypothetical protein